VNNFKNSKKLYKRALMSVAEGVSSRARGVKGGYTKHPIYIDRAKGSRIYDVDGNEYIDYLQALGPAFLGHANPLILDFVAKEQKKGTTYALGTELEIKVAEKLIKYVPCFDKVGFVNSGTEAVQMVLELARGYTGKRKIIKFEGHYHGWLGNVYVSVAPSLEKAGSEFLPSTIPASIGSPKSATSDTIILPWNNKEIINKIIKEQANEIAAVIMEPYMANCGLIPPEDGYLEFVRKITEENNILLIFDEVITGFRLSLGGAQEFFKVTPDLADMGKICGGGYPVAVYGGKAKVMDVIGKVAHAGTLNANVPSMAAAYATLKYLEENKDIYQNLSLIGNSLIYGIREIINDLKIKAIVQGLPSMFQIYFTNLPRLKNYREVILCNDSIFNEMWKRLLLKGVLIRPRYFGNIYVSAAHSKEDIGQTLQVFREVLLEMKKDNCL
jgi:glutamate-1-semialdehyde 2,1-aminomutase